MPRNREMNRAVDCGHVSTWTNTVSKTCGCFPQVPYWGCIGAILDSDEGSIRAL